MKVLPIWMGLTLSLLGVVVSAPDVQASPTLCREPISRNRSSNSTTTSTSPPPTTTSINDSREYSSQTLFFLGDSLSIGTEVIGSMSTKLLKLGIWRKILADCKIGRTITGGAMDLRSRLLRSKNISAVVIALGTNDLQSRTEGTYPRLAIDLVMAEAQKLPVLWVNIAYDRKLHPDYDRRAKKFNTALILARKTYKNLFIATWDKASVEQSSKYEKDGIHLMPSGYRSRTDFLVPTIAKFWKKQSRLISIPTATTTTLFSAPSAGSYSAK